MIYVFHPVDCVEFCGFAICHWQSLAGIAW